MLSDIIDRVCAVGFIVVGVSHVVHARRWADFFTGLERSPGTALVIGALTLPMGLFIALGHDVWGVELRVVVTLCGWAMVLKGALYLLFPAAFQAMVKAKGDPERLARFMRSGGTMMALLGAALVKDWVWS